MMSNTTSHILLLIQCVLESCIWILFSEKKDFVSCVCNWILCSEKKRFLFLVFVIGYIIRFILMLYLYLLDIYIYILRI